MNKVVSVRTIFIIAIAYVVLSELSYEFGWATGLAAFQKACVVVALAGTLIAFSRRAVGQESP